MVRDLNSPKLLADAVLSRPQNRILVSHSGALFALGGHCELRQGQGLPPLSRRLFLRQRQSFLRYAPMAFGIIPDLAFGLAGIPTILLSWLLSSIAVCFVVILVLRIPVRSRSYGSTSA